MGVLSLPADACLVWLGHGTLAAILGFRAPEPSSLAVGHQRHFSFTMSQTLVIPWAGRSLVRRQVLMTSALRHTPSQSANPSGRQPAKRTSMIRTTSFMPGSAMIMESGRLWPPISPNKPRPTQTPANNGRPAARAPEQPGWPPSTPCLRLSSGRSTTSAHSPGVSPCLTCEVTCSSVSSISAASRSGIGSTCESFVYLIACMLT